MSDQNIFPVPEEISERSFIDNAKYLELYQQSVNNPENFWAAQGKRIDWIKPYNKIKDVILIPSPVAPKTPIIIDAHIIMEAIVAICVPERRHV